MAKVLEKPGLLPQRTKQKEICQIASSLVMGVPVSIFVHLRWKSLSFGWGGGIGCLTPNKSTKIKISGINEQ